MRFEFSAGGVVVKNEQDKWYVLLVKHAQYGHWGFPKGHIGDVHKGETKEATAIREVKEETGIDAEIMEPLSPIEYWYTFEGEKRKKTVYFFLMKPTGGEFSEKDHEMEEVDWFPLDEASARITYDSEKKVFEEVLRIIKVA